eukprot:1161053-Pelagomonas_calceolata.AAC.5
MSQSSPTITPELFSTLPFLARTQTESLDLPSLAWMPPTQSLLGSIAMSQSSPTITPELHTSLPCLHASRAGPFRWHCREPAATQAPPGADQVPGQDLQRVAHRYSPSRKPRGHVPQRLALL